MFYIIRFGREIHGTTCIHTFGGGWEAETMREGWNNPAVRFCAAPSYGRGDIFIKVRGSIGTDRPTDNRDRWWNGRPDRIYFGVLPTNHPLARLIYITYINLGYTFILVASLLYTASFFSVVPPPIFWGLAVCRSSTSLAHLSRIIYLLFWVRDVTEWRRTCKWVNRCRLKKDRGWM